MNINEKLKNLVRTESEKLRERTKETQETNREFSRQRAAALEEFEKIRPMLRELENSEFGNYLFVNIENDQALGIEAEIHCDDYDSEKMTESAYRWGDFSA